MSVGSGMVGAGGWGKTHARVYVDHPGVELAAVCDLDEGGGQAIAERYGVLCCYTDHADLLTEDGIDAVSIVMSDFAPPKIVVAAAQTGKHILLEKPMATTVEDCRAIAEALER